MKIVIDIAQEVYTDIKDGYYNHNVTSMGYAIQHGTVLPDNPTNGDMIKALFPNIKWFINEDDEIFTDHKTLNSNRVALTRDWWNAPYERSTDADNK